jgi:hypothetical protein
MREHTEKRGFFEKWRRPTAYKLAARLTDPGEAIRFAVFWSRHTQSNNDPPDGLLVGTSRRLLIVTLFARPAP